MFPLAAAARKKKWRTEGDGEVSTAGCSCQCSLLRLPRRLFREKRGAEQRHEVSLAHCSCSLEKEKRDAGVGLLHVGCSRWKREGKKRGEAASGCWPRRYPSSFAGGDGVHRGC
ncbi:hypothetical protein AABB24_014023 [Solanum stoloniferum]|uniref:Uncharacterized protein n=1 Tax=Solanum stoloniferum TaxID=62892 RepID=A0ABD2TWP5_9SOLN